MPTPHDRTRPLSSISAGGRCRGRAQERPDLLLSDFTVQTYPIHARISAQGPAAYEADRMSLAVTCSGRRAARRPARRSASATRPPIERESARHDGPAGTPPATLTGWRRDPDGTSPATAASPAQLADARPPAIGSCAQIYQDFESDANSRNRSWSTASCSISRRYEWYSPRQRISLAASTKDRPSDRSGGVLAAAVAPRGFATNRARSLRHGD